MKKIVKLQGEANDINASMCHMMERYFESKDTDK